MVDINQRISVFAQLGNVLRKFRLGINSGHHLSKDFFNRLQRAVDKAGQQNGWFTKASVERAIDAWASELTNENLTEWISRYPDFQEPKRPKRVAIIMAGNIPLVGFHDFLTALMCGHSVLAKMSSDDQAVLPVLVDALIELAPAFKERITLVERIEQPDAVIATGSNNSARYFETYFEKYPHIIRKNRTSVAVFTGEETEDELKRFGADLFAFFGMGCRNVSKFYVPHNFDLDRVFGALLDFSGVMDNHKYANNYDYYRAIYMLNKEAFLENGFVLFRQHESLHTPIAVIHFERYQNRAELDAKLKEQQEELQCVVGRGAGMVPFGQSQQPKLWDYADGVDTMQFLQRLA